MKKSLLLAMAVLTLTASSAFAAKGEWMGGGQAGAHMPLGDYKDNAKTGFLGGVFLDYMVSDMISLGANLDYHATSAENAIADSIGAEDIDFTVLSYGVNGALFFTSEGTAKPYVKVGAGMYNVKAEVKGGPFDGVTAFDETKFGFAGGAGLMFRPAGSSIGFGVEGMFHNVPDAIEDFNGQLSAAQFITATARISFSFSDMTQTP